MANMLEDGRNNQQQPSAASDGCIEPVPRGEEITSTNQLLLIIIAYQPFPLLSSLSFIR